MRSMPLVNSGSHLPSCAAEVSPFCSPSTMASAAIDPDFSANNTPDE